MDIKVIKQNDTGRNTHFQDTRTGQTFTRAGLVKEINQGNYQDLHVRKVNGLNTPVSNPDKSKNNNLG